MPVVILFTLAVGFLGNFYPGLKVNALDLSPNYAGSLMALTNGIGGLTGIGVPPLVGNEALKSSLKDLKLNAKTACNNLGYVLMLLMSLISVGNDQVFSYA